MERIRLFKEEWLQILILAVPFILIALLWNSIPERVPMHWGMNGKANGFATKGIALFILPMVNIGLAALLLWLSTIDPKAYKMKLPGASLKPIRLTITAFLSALMCISIIPSVGENLNASMMDVSVAILILILGNYLPKVKPNYFLGVRTPWALEDPENWRITHQFSGRLWVIAALVYLVLSLLLPGSVQEVVFLGFIAIIVIPPYIYSYMLFQRSKHA